MKKSIALLLFLLPLFALADEPVLNWTNSAAGYSFADNTAAIQALINSGGTLTTGSYNITSVSMTHSFNFNGSTLTALSATGAMINCNTAGVTVQNAGLNGGSGTYNASGLSGVAINAANVTLNSVSVSNVSNYGFVGGAFSNETINNCSVFNSGYIGISMITNTTAVTGIVITNNSINRGPQGIGVQQPALIVRANLPGTMTGSVITGNVITMPASPTNAAGECFEIRNNDRALVNNNSYSGGSIGYSMVGCTNSRSPNGNYSGQSLEAIEIVNCSNSSAGTGSGAISSGVKGIFVDGNVSMANDTITASTISGLSSYPIQLNPIGPPSRTIAQAQGTIVSLFINNVTATTKTNAIYGLYASNITANNNVFSGNNTTCAVFFDTSLGGFTDNNSTYSGFTTWGCSFGQQATTINNILTTGVVPGGAFLKLTPGVNITLGPNIKFNPVVVSPPVITYPTPNVFTQNVPAGPVNPTNSGGAATGWSVSPALPIGLVLSTSTGQISGTPSVLSPATNYAVTATNTGGSGHFTLSISVLAKKPNISYSPSSQMYTQGTAIAPWSAVNTGDPVVTWTISPALPTGLIFSNGTITGNPSVVQGATTYKVKASNTGGADSTNISITVRVALPQFSYAPFSNTYLSGITITPLTPTSTGGAVVSYSVSPALPASLSLNTSTGVISGTTGASSPSTVYVITGTNATGIGTGQVAIQINPNAPVISYVPDTMSYVQFISIVPVLPTNTGGQVAGYSVSPALPTGLLFDTVSGAIYGSPLLASPQTSYTIVGSNVSGSSTTHVVITVTASSGGGGIIRVAGRTAVVLPAK